MDLQRTIENYNPNLNDLTTRRPNNLTTQRLNNLTTQRTPKQLNFVPGPENPQNFTEETGSVNLQKCVVTL